jgi:hypothetical protein
VEKVLGLSTNLSDESSRGGLYLHKLPQ